MFRSVTDWNARVDNLESLPDYFLQAFQQLRSGRPRPVELEIPTDLLSQKVDAEILSSRELEIPQPDSSQIEQAAQALLKAKRPLIWAGSGVISANATPELRRLAETLDAPVVTYRTSKGAFPDDHPLSLGVGEFGDDKSPLEDFLRRCDLVLLVGCSMGYSRIRRTGLKLPSNLVQIDIDPKMIGRNYAVPLGIVGDAKLAVQQLYLLAAEEGGGSDATYAKDVAQCKKDVRQSLSSHFPNEMKTLEGIRGILARDAIVVGDPTVPFARAMRCLPMYEPRTCIGPWGWDGLGFGFPAGLGAKVGRPDRQVVVITGDGGFQYNLQELGTAIQYDINPVVLIFNDNAWGVLKGYQHDKFDGRYFATNLMNPDFVKLAEAYGAGISKVHSRSGLLKSLGDALESKVVHLILVEMPQGFARFT